MLQQLSQDLAKVAKSPLYIHRPMNWQELLDAAEAVASPRAIPVWLQGYIQACKESYKHPWKYVKVVNEADFWDSSASPMENRFFEEPQLLGKVGPAYLLLVGRTPGHPKIAALYTPDTTRRQSVTAVDLDALLGTLQAPVEWEKDQRPQDA